MDINHLIYFSAVCETLNYTEAAKQCFITRQAMRQSIQGLEQTFGVCLIENRQNHLSLTPAGKRLYQKSKKVLESWSDLREAMNVCALSGQTLRVGISRSITPFYAPEILDHVQNLPSAYPGLAVKVELLPADEILRQLEEGKLDAGILVDMGSFPAPLKRTVLRSDHLTLFVSVSNPLARKDNLSLSDLDGQSITIMSNPEPCFLALTKTVKESNLQVNWKVAPDFYEAGYLVLQERHLAVDRGEEFIQEQKHIDASVSTNLLKEVTLENGAFMLYCCLFTPRSESPTVRILRETLTGL